MFVTMVVANYDCASKEEEKEAGVGCGPTMGGDEFGVEEDNVEFSGEVNEVADEGEVEEKDAVKCLEQAAEAIEEAKECLSGEDEEVEFEVEDEEFEVEDEEFEVEDEDEDEDEVLEVHTPVGCSGKYTGYMFLPNFDPPP